MIWFLSYFGRIDVLINCAGANFARAPVSNLDTGDLRNMLEVNLIAPFFLMQSVFNESMRERQTGTILNVLSTVCLYSNPNIGAYTAAKSGFDALVNVFRKETRNYGVKVCSIYPGGVDTDFRSNATPDYLTAQSVAESIIFMLSQEGNSALDSLTIRPMIENNFA